jgi:hypothetical protein
MATPHGLSQSAKQCSAALQAGRPPPVSPPAIPGAHRNMSVQHHGAPQLLGLLHPLLPLLHERRVPARKCLAAMPLAVPQELAACCWRQQLMAAPPLTWLSAAAAAAAAVACPPPEAANNAPLARPAAASAAAVNPAAALAAAHTSQQVLPRRGQQALLCVLETVGRCSLLLALCQ